jgi:hypothetical protein
MAMAVTGVERPELERIGPWRLEMRLGAGGFGTVWRATDAGGRAAVVKLLSAPPGDELRALSRVHHPALARAISGGSHPVPHLVMEQAPGVPLSNWTASCRPGQRALPTREALRVIAVLADALAACHDAWIPHGDIKPSNVVFDPSTGGVVLVDFGLSGGFGGTPEYAAPEVLEGKPAGDPADMYSLGLLALELLQGPPTQDLATRLTERMQRSPEVPPELGEPLAPLLLGMLSLDPSRRPSARWVADTLESMGAPLPVRTADEIARRSWTVSVRRPEVDEAVARWLERGGALAVTGPSGSGRSHALTAVAQELQARGQPFVLVSAGGPPWAAIEAALCDPSLPGAIVPLPLAVDVATRSEMAAEALTARADGRMLMLVDGFDQLDEGSRRVVEALVRAGASVLLSAQKAPAGVQKAALDPLDAPRIERLVEGLLGPVDPIVAQHAQKVGRWPGPLVAFCVEAVRKEALVWRRGAWVVDPVVLDTVEPVQLAQSPDLRHLSEEVCTLGAAVALASR